MIQNKEQLQQLHEEAVKELNSYDCRILVCSGTGCIATGSNKIYEKFLEITKDAPGVTLEFAPHDEKEHLGVKKTGCQGVCELGPDKPHFFVTRHDFPTFRLCCPISR